jgi:IMP dehydrogenase
MVGAAVSIDEQTDWDRTMALIEAGADLVYLDTSSARNSYECEFIKRLKAEYPQVDVVAGPVCSCREAKCLGDVGVDAIVVGSSSSSVIFGDECSNVGRPEATGTFQISRYVTLNYGIPTIAQGGLRNAGHILKALGLGASAVFLDELLSASLEAPSREFLQAGVCARLGGGSAAVTAVQSAKARHDPTGIAQLTTQTATGAVITKGSVCALAPYIASGLRNGFYDLGIRSMPDLHRSLLEGTLKMERRSFFGQKQAERLAFTAQCTRMQYIQPLPA